MRNISSRYKNFFVTMEKALVNAADISRVNLGKIKSVVKDRYSLVQERVLSPRVVRFLRPSFFNKSLLTYRCWLTVPCCNNLLMSCCEF
jgi:hypothetical protein